MECVEKSYPSFWEDYQSLGGIIDDLRTWKNNIEITIFGESHGKAIGIVLGNLPSGIKIDLEEVAKEMKRRAPGQDKMSTARKEADKVEIMSGLQDDVRLVHHYVE